MPSVSILVPIYNVEKYLDKCLESIRAQTLKDIEVICINDGSTDGSPGIIREFMDRDPRFRIIDKKNSGYGDSMNRGLKAAKGEFIGIVESDDFIEPDMFETLLKLAKKDRLDIARSEFFYYENSDRTNRKSDNRGVPHNKVIRPSQEHSVFYQQPSIWASLYRAEFLRRNGIDFLPTPGASYQDTSFSFKVYACARRFEMIDKAFYHYRINAGSSSFQSTTKVYCVCDEYAEIWRYVRSKGLYGEYRTLIPCLQFNGYKWNYNRLAEPYNAQFMERFQKEFAELQKEGNLVPEKFSARDYNDILSVISDGVLISQTKPIVSVIVPIYNSEKYLRQCLDSLMCQTIREIEIICVDDGSTDSSSKILSECAARDSRIKVYTKKNGGQASARNLALGKASGQYISFVDSDDWIERNTYEVQLRNMESNDVAVFASRIVGEVDPARLAKDVEYYRVKFSGEVELNDDIISKTDASVWNKIYRKELIDRYSIRFPEGLRFEDYAFYWKYMIVCKRAFFDTRIFYNYRRHEGSTMNQTFRKSPRAIDHLRSFRDAYLFMENNGLAAQRKDTINRMFLLSFWFAYQNSPQNCRKKVLKEASGYVRRYGLKGDSVIEALGNKEWEKVDPQRGYEKKKGGFLSRLVASYEKSSGTDLTTFRKMLGGTYREADSRSEAVATTEWVNRHEDFYGIDRWAPIYDAMSKDAKINLGFKGGIIGGTQVTADFVRKIVPGKRYKALVSL